MHQMLKPGFVDCNFYETMLYLLVHIVGPFRQELPSFYSHYDAYLAPLEKLTSSKFVSKVSMPLLQRSQCNRVITQEVTGDKYA